MTHHARAPLPQRPYTSLSSLPSDLSGARFRMNGDDFAVLSFSTNTTELPGTLSAGEREVLCAVVCGDTNREIATSRRTSTRTVANQVQAIFRKLGVHSRSELAVWCARTGVGL